MNRNGKSRPLKKRPSTISGVTKPTFVTACQPLTGRRAFTQMWIQYNTATLKKSAFEWWWKIWSIVPYALVILSRQNNAEFLIIFLYQLQSFWAGPLFQSVLFLSVWSSWQGWCSLFMTRGHRRLGISVSPSNPYLYCISAHTTFNFDQLDIINIVVIFNTWTIHKTDLSLADIWFWRRMMEAAPNWFPKGGKANQTDPALVWSTSLSSVQQSTHWSNQLSNQAPSHPIDPHHIHFSHVTDEKKFSWNVVTFHSWFSTGELLNI